MGLSPYPTCPLTPQTGGKKFLSNCRLLPTPRSSNPWLRQSKSPSSKFGHEQSTDFAKAGMNVQLLPKSKWVNTDKVRLRQTMFADVERHDQHCANYLVLDLFFGEAAFQQRLVALQNEFKNLYRWNENFQHILLEIHCAENKKTAAQRMCYNNDVPNLW